MADADTMTSETGTRLMHAPSLFPQLVRQDFEFVGNFGFEEAEALPTLLCYRKGELEVRVYHGRISCEVAVEVIRGDELFSLGELMRATDPEIAEQYCNPRAIIDSHIAAAVKQVAGLFQRYGQRALRDDPVFFKMIEHKRKAWTEEFTHQIRANQKRPSAEEAFRRRDYQRAAELYQEFYRVLTPAEKRKLEIALKRAGEEVC